MKFGMILATLGLALITPAHAGNSTGTVGQVAVRPLEIYVELQAPQFAGFPCGSTHPNGFRYALSLNSAGAREMLAAILTAQASGKPLQIVGTGGCTIESRMENIAYVVLQP